MLNRFYRPERPAQDAVRFVVEAGDVAVKQPCLLQCQRGLVRMLHTGMCHDYRALSWRFCHTQLATIARIRHLTRPTPRRSSSVRGQSSAAGATPVSRYAPRTRAAKTVA